MVCWKVRTAYLDGYIYFLLSQLKIDLQQASFSRQQQTTTTTFTFLAQQSDIPQTITILFHPPPVLLFALAVMCKKIVKQYLCGCIDEVKVEPCKKGNGKSWFCEEKEEVLPTLPFICPDCK
jgi:hypothetical protein